jgi:hypothetical protein
MARVGPVQRVCGSCGQDPGAGAFCQHCGTRLTGPGDMPSNQDESPSAPPPQPAVPAPPPQAVVPAPPPQAPAASQVPARRKGRGAGCLIVVFVVLAAVTAGMFLAWRYIESEILPSIQGVQEVADQFENLTGVPGPPGPCYDLDVERGLVIGWVEVSCDGPRDVEAFFWADFRDEPYPGDVYIADAAAHTCGEAFALYIGATVERSQYAVDWIVPSEATWSRGDRETVCLVVSGAGSPLTGTVKGSNA